MKSIKTMDVRMTCGTMPSAQINLPALASVGGGLQGSSVSTSVIGDFFRDRVARYDVIHVDVIPSTDKFADGVSRSAPDRPPV